MFEYLLASHATAYPGGVASCWRAVSRRERDVDGDDDDADVDVDGDEIAFDRAVPILGWCMS